MPTRPRFKLPPLQRNADGFREAVFDYRGRTARLVFSFALRLWLDDLELRPDLVLDASEIKDWDEMLQHPLAMLATHPGALRMVTQHVELILRRFSDVLDQASR